MTGLYDLLPEPRRIDYDMMRREYPKLKSALTRAEKSGDPIAVLRAVERFIEVSDAVGCMPDDWHRWNIALGDAWNVLQRTTLADFGDDVFDGSGDASPVLRFQRAAARLA